MVMRKIPQSYYGDQARWFIGVVVNNSDNDMLLGRVQIRIFGIHDDTQKIPDSMLPWAQVLVPSTEDGISGLGFKPNIANGATVFGFFFDGPQSQLPFVLGTIPKIQAPNSSQVATTTETPQFRNGTAPVTGGLFGSLPGGRPGSSYARITAGTGVQSVTTTQLVGANNAEKIFNFFVLRGFTAEQAAGIVGNFAVESRLDPTIVNPNDSGAPAYGLAQWRLDRYTGLVEYAQNNGSTWEDIGMQLEWTLQELPRNGAAQLRQARTVRQATRAFMLKFERPAGTLTDSVPSEQERIRLAQQYYEQFV